MDEHIDYKTELERAYRAIRGIYGRVAMGNKLTPEMLAYHSLTLAAAMRYVGEGELDGSAYFIGKTPETLQHYLRRYNGQPFEMPPILGSEADHRLIPTP